MPERQATKQKPISMRQVIPRDAEQRLLEERKEVIREISEQAENAGNVARAGVEDPDYAQISQIRDLQYSRRELLNRRLRQLDDALGRFHSGVYGICTECGRVIAEKRLAADPAVALCLNCQASRESVATAITL